MSRPRTTAVVRPPPEVRMQLGQQSRQPARAAEYSLQAIRSVDGAVRCLTARIWCMESHSRRACCDTRVPGSCADGDVADVARRLPSSLGGNGGTRGRLRTPSLLRTTRCSGIVLRLCPRAVLFEDHDAVTGSGYSSCGRVLSGRPRRSPKRFLIGSLGDADVHA